MKRRKNILMRSIVLTNDEEWNDAFISEMRRVKKNFFNWIEERIEW